ncbi:MAG TPA: HAMP domain-containing sensor histidine kinase [Clostridiales bacterium]|nr:HAMP domain-containing sensor histidine kinase [Clostridiales bacterium]HXK83057.1 HAMP domain-containing sensor histidine kinase [Clostridiales bacterium]
MKTGLKPISLMQNFMQKGSFFKRLFFVLAFVILSSLVFLGLLMMIFVSGFWSRECIESLQSDAISMASFVGSFYESGKLDDLNSPEGENSAILICSALSRLSESSNSTIFICDLEGKPILSKEMLSDDMTEIVSEPSTNGIIVTRELIESIGPEGFGGAGRYSSSIEKYFVGAMPVYSGNSLKAIVIAAQPVGIAFRPYFLSVLYIFLIAAFCALIVGLVSVYIISDSVTKPLNLMSQAIKQYAEGNFAYRLPVRGDDEISTLCASINYMAGALAALEESRRSFVANVSHELKTPMTSIAGFIDGILDGTIDEKNQKHYLRIVSAEVNRLSRLVTSMLNLSKIETGEVQLKPKTFNIGEQVLKAMLTFEKPISDKRINVTGLDKIGSVYVNADEDMIYQVIFNLIDNAVKFTNEGGTISVSIFERNDGIELSVRNTGSYIPKEEIGNIFDRFYKVDKSRSLDAKSAGLGLYIVKSIVEMHGGNIKVTSIKDQYTEFLVFIPSNNTEPLGYN